MSFSSEAKDFLSAYKMGADGVDKQHTRELQDKLYTAHANYYDAAAKNAGKPTGVGASDAIGADGAFQEGFGHVTGAPSIADKIGAGIKSMFHHSPAAAAPGDAAGAIDDGNGIETAEDDGGDGYGMPAFKGGGLVDDGSGYNVAEPALAPADENAATDPEPEASTPALPVQSPQLAPPARPGAPVAPAGAAGPQYPDNLLGAALHGGAMFLSKVFGLGEKGATGEPGAVPAGDTKPQAMHLLRSGAGAADAQDVEDLYKTIDPEGKLDDSIRTIAGIKSVYEYHLKRGDVDGADKAAASLIQYARGVSAQFGQHALDAIQKGDMRAGVEALLKGYSAIPDGNHITVQQTPKGPAAVMTDADGKVVQAQILSPQNLIGAAMGMRDGSLFYNTILSAAGKHLGDEQRPSEAYMKFLGPHGMDADEPGAVSETATAPAATPEAVPATAPGPQAPAPQASSSPGGTTAAAPPVGAPAPTAPAAGPQAGEDWSTPGAQEAYQPTAGKRPVEPKYIDVGSQLDASMKPDERRDVMQTVRQRNLNMKREYTEKLKAWEDANKADAAAAKAGVKSGGPAVKPEKRGAVTGEISSAVEDMASTLTGADGNAVELSDQDKHAIGAIGYHIYSTNDVPAEQAVRMSAKLLAVDPTNPGAPPVKSSQKIPGGVRVVFNDGSTADLSSNSLAEISALRSAKVKAAQAVIDKQKGRAETVKKVVGAAKEGASAVSDFVGSLKDKAKDALTAQAATDQGRDQDASNVGKPGAPAEPSVREKQVAAYRADTPRRMADAKKSHDDRWEALARFARGTRDAVFDRGDAGDAARSGAIHAVGGAINDAADGVASTVGPAARTLQRVYSRNSYQQPPARR